MPPVRTFIAVDVDPQVRRRAEDMIRQLASSGASAKWVEPEQMHVTLKFLGDVEQGELHRVAGAVETAAAGLPPFEVAFGGAGAFPSIQRPRTLWLGVAEGAEPIALLQERIERELEKLGFPKENRRFHAHLTLGRIRGRGPERALTDALTTAADFDAGPSIIDRVITFSSSLSRHGPKYEPIATVELEP